MGNSSIAELFGEDEDVSVPPLGRIPTLIEEAQDIGTNVRAERERHLLRELKTGPLSTIAYDHLIEHLDYHHPLDGDDFTRVDGTSGLYQSVKGLDVQPIDPLGIAEKNRADMRKDPGMREGRRLILYGGRFHEDFVLHAIRTLEGSRAIYHPLGRAYTDL